MKELRNLLIDCRIELRKQVRDFHKSPLCERLDAAVQGLTSAANAGHSAPPSPATPIAEKTATPNQVALAWQAAVRDLKFSDPALYESLGKKVMARLELKSMVDPATELLQLEQAVTKLQSRRDADERAKQNLASQRDALLAALAAAAPQLAEAGDPVAVALARIDWLKREKAKDRSESIAASAIELESYVPTTEILNAVAAGSRGLTDGQREWCVGEAMVLTGFQVTPVELLARGDSQIARLILESRRG
jgi:hypothetical protein